MSNLAVGKARNACRKGLLTLGLLVAAGCQTTSEYASDGQPAYVDGGVFDSVNSPAKPYGRSAGSPDANQPHTLWSRLRAGFLLDPAAIDDPRIDQQRLAFASQPRYFELSTQRARRYLHYVTEQVEAREMPSELALLPFVESSYNPMAYSSAKAAGLWQFIPSTGQLYSLRQDWWYDGRRDITASTRAALDYLTRLNQQFDGDWLLALAAYNCGEGCVGRAVKRNRKLGLPTDYWSLQLPRETMNYVPKLLALAQIIESPAVYGTVLPALHDEPYFAEITVDQQIDLHKAAELASISTEELLSLNPAFNHRVTAPKGSYQLLVPVANAEQFAAALVDLPESERLGFQPYQVRRGDTLSQIARRHQVNVSAIRDVNNLDGNVIHAGQTLMLPQFGDSIAPPTALASASAPKPASYKVKPGDNLWLIARKHGISVSNIQQHNKLKGSALTVGQTLSLPGATLAVASGPRKHTYVVRAGDSLYSIARQFKVGIDSIRKWNALGPVLRPGQQLTLHLP
ncbi:membrane-bound lytic murein transglycosylase D [Halopseudomonas xinjiangensis]|uniref:Membrane-bound lytic murein transglycosylase D n=1 Tax=Halopseudomonas xinjiangensis TaxID=487184 RepID=A0A1H1RWD1_9GAMM|nr:LysM peptidoglycan-binding domain-containing protein [Halopseudomonas xinjiangensis]SDS40091.1 membrane-bound lytic murein transglycosylase D [Halopseudomonas xinjiangensis]